MSRLAFSARASASGALPVLPALLAFATLLAVSIPAHPRDAAAGESLPRHEDESDILGTTPSADEGAVGALFNPAQWGLVQRPELAFWWSDRNVRKDALDNWGLALGKRLGFSVRRHDLVTPEGRGSVTDWQLGLGTGRPGHVSGVAFGWSTGEAGSAHRPNFLALGGIHRPLRRLSVGGTTRLPLGSGGAQSRLDLAVRPLADPRILLFADYARFWGETWKEGALAGGVSLRPVPGLEGSARLREGGEFQLSFGVVLQRTGFQVLPRYDSDGKLGATNYVLRAEAPRKGFDLDSRLRRGKRFLELDLHGRAVYQSFRFGDERSLPLRDLVGSLEAAREDPTVAGVAINLSGFEANPNMAWEVREKLLDLRAAGKTVVVYSNEFGLTSYYLASAADRVVLHPEGFMLLPGVQVSRTYMKDLLAKLGVAYEEWRYFKYKSAAETLSRSSMSEADREQLQELVDGGYDAAASGIAAGRRMDRAAVDRLVNEEPVLTARRAKETGLIDAAARWEDVARIAKEAAGHEVKLTGRAALEWLRWQPEEEWGDPPVIALVYAVGECAMDTGIRARSTSAALRRFRGQRDVKAVVLRADSPGGDPIASDLVAHELRKLKEAKKPALVSQGRVAASGGYWISMDGDSIHTSPFTITGSIGVIGGWFWNDGLGKKLGLTSDRVQAGKSADLFGGLRLPILQVTVPERNLTEGERGLVRNTMLELYDNFTRGVARGRRVDPGHVREIGEGRVYLGPRAIQLKLADRVATLEETLESAKRAAGIPRGRRVAIVEYPKRGLFRFPSLSPFALLGVGALEPGSPGGSPGGRTWEECAVEQVLRAPGRPLALTPSTLLPDEQEVAR